MFRATKSALVHWNALPARVERRKANPETPFGFGLVGCPLYGLACLFDILTGTLDGLAAGKAGHQGQTDEQQGNNTHLLDLDATDQEKAPWQTESREAGKMPSTNMARPLTDRATRAPAPAVRGSSVTASSKYMSLMMRR